ncbi:undecaprenyldiphospho-muramoylpentapeptide beta-N-acetylglucosaminyltransferase [Suttonella ornithocola]|uniref:UDP-N-acetylglucosamine--N-acetylmuramyl-(pentapeptide) pyrophosphoryl-undecaprenol N-acetylglucosamine transferase n=1 Tax=Suttonella ornithocola TaxID=279832 RepID=A0A380MXD3_9GAMM|nr:undecaprenyldiphospho-muramoylpentapeptide beta-N-acetylglucosaminyltransferase [Suttonella ornithocola]SUO97235.1 UDP-N-acetylglucosamine--N-acetylmuramyl-(pentapeptide) pyrophosphoryl-undecaprenol N-acetylglucosamine transferase [Suttonella ornithocola]
MRSVWQGKTVLMMAGGTGGHVYPALAVARAAREKGAVIHWLGNKEGFEGKKVSEAGFELHDIAVRGLRGKGLLGWLKAPFMVYRARARAKSVMKEIQPDVVIGMGGFVSGPGGLAAKALGIPLVIHEQNAVMGMTNTWLAKFADKVLLADDRAANKLSSGKSYVLTGNPVRSDIAAVAAPSKRYPFHYGSIKLLVLGGSQGASAINTLVPQALALLPERQRPTVLHQCGERWLKETERCYADLGIRAKVVAFIDDMAEAYGNSDWVIARSGALTVAEIATVGLPAIFIPFPHAVDDHQTMNAQQLAEAGAASVIAQSELTAEKLAKLIAERDLRTDLAEQAKKAYQCSHRQALDKILSEIEEIL